jgi:hypothetical protein
VFELVCSFYIVLFCSGLVCFVLRRVLTCQVKLSDLVAAIYKLLALKDHHNAGSYALSQRLDVSLLTSLLTEKGQTHSSKTGSVGVGGGGGHASPMKNSHVHASPTRAGQSAMKQREVLLTIGTMANLIGWFGALGTSF